MPFSDIQNKIRCIINTYWKIKWHYLGFGCICESELRTECELETDIMHPHLKLEQMISPSKTEATKN